MSPWSYSGLKMTTQTSTSPRVMMVIVSESKVDHNSLLPENPTISVSGAAKEAKNT